MKCDALLVDTISRSDTYPYIRVDENDVGAFVNDWIVRALARGLDQKTVRAGRRSARTVLPSETTVSR